MLVYLGAVIAVASAAAADRLAATMHMCKYMLQVLLLPCSGCCRTTVVGGDARIATDNPYGVCYCCCFCECWAHYCYAHDASTPLMLTLFPLIFFS